MEFYYSDGQNQFGPVSLEELRTKIDANTLVWHDGMPNWDKASNVEEMKAILRPTPPPPPVAPQMQAQIPELYNVKKKDIGLLVMAIIGLLVSLFSVLLGFAIASSPRNISVQAWGATIFLICIYIVAFSIVAIVKSCKTR